MESFMRRFVLHLLVRDGGTPIDSDHINILNSVIMRGDADHRCSGDVVIPLKSPKVTSLAISNPNSPLHTCINRCENSFESVKKVLSSYDIPIEKIWIEKNLLCFAFKRTVVISSALKAVHESGQEYGKSQLLHLTKVVIFHDTTPEKRTSAKSYRGHVILNHIVRNLKFVGAEVQTYSHDESVAEREENQVAEIESTRDSDGGIPNVLQANPVISTECVTPKETNIVVNGQILTLSFTSHGKSEILSNIERSRCLKYMHLVSSETGKAWKVSSLDHFKILLNELRNAMELKYGDITSDEGSQFLNEQAWQCMTLHLLSKNYSDNLRVEIDGCTQNTKDWAFVLYNYARLKMIFKAFDAQVAQGDFAPLPSIEGVDISLLKYDEEWVLVWKYVLRWPEIVEEFASSFVGDVRKIKTSAVSRFMHSLCHRISVYYSRFRVLISEPLPHMIPLMYSRLYFLKALLIVMDKCFELMGIDSPPECM